MLYLFINCIPFPLKLWQITLIFPFFLFGFELVYLRIDLTLPEHNFSVPYIHFQNSLPVSHRAVLFESISDSLFSIILKFDLPY